MTARLSLPALFTIFILAATIGAAAGLTMAERGPIPGSGFESPAGAEAPAPMLPEGMAPGIGTSAPAPSSTAPVPTS